MTKDYVVVTTLTHFKVKYAIPLDEFEKLGFAEPIDQLEVLNKLSEWKEFSQSHLGDVVGDVSVFSEDDILAFFDLENSYLASWPKEQKIAWINKWKLDAEEG